METEFQYVHYLRHLYVSMAKLVEPLTGDSSMSIKQLYEVFNTSPTDAIEDTIEWLDLQIEFTEKRHNELKSTKRELEVPTHLGVLIGGWKFLRAVVKKGHFHILKNIWQLLTTCGIPETERNQCIWHIGAILYHWIDEGLRQGRILPPSRYIYTPDGGLWSNYDGEEDELQTTMKAVALHLKILRCYLNVTASEGEAILRKRIKENTRRRTVYLFRLSATVPGEIVLQFILPGVRHPTVNVRINATTMGREFYTDFFMSQPEYRAMCEEWIANYARMQRIPIDFDEGMIQVQPTMSQSVGLTDSYNCYFDVKNRLEPIPLFYS